VDNLASGVSSLTRRKTENVTTLQGFEASFTTKAGLFASTNAAEWLPGRLWNPPWARRNGMLCGGITYPSRRIFPSAAPNRRI